MKGFNSDRAVANAPRGVEREEGRASLVGGLPLRKLIPVRPCKDGLLIRPSVQPVGGLGLNSSPSSILAVSSGDLQPFSKPQIRRLLVLDQQSVVSVPPAPSLAPPRSLT